MTTLRVGIDGKIKTVIAVCRMVGDEGILEGVELIDSIGGQELEFSLPDDSVALPGVMKMWESIPGVLGVEVEASDERD